MLLWIMLLLFAAALGLGALYYLITRMRRFAFMTRLAEKNKFLSWLLAVSMVCLLFLFAVINIYSVVIVVLHLALFWLICDLISGLIHLIHKTSSRKYIAGICALLLTAVYLGIGWINAHHVRETDYSVSTGKDVAPLRIALIADSHLGITLDGRSFQKEMDKIQKTQPDLIVVVGDFVDDDSTRADMLDACRTLGNLKTTYGTYFTFGNHDSGYFRQRDFSAAELRKALTDNGITILEDEMIPLGENYLLAGRKDRSYPSRLSAEELLSHDSGKYTIVLDHQPNDYAAEANAGADLVLSGHTHGGHIFPAGLIGLWMHANDALYGMSHRSDTTFIVTSGISGWAIPFKTGTFSEYVIIDIRSELS